MVRKGSTVRVRQRALRSSRYSAVSPTRQMPPTPLGDERGLKQAYAQAKHLERITGQQVAPLPVFSDAYLDRPVSRRRGVTVLNAGRLPGHLIDDGRSFRPSRSTTC